MKILHVFKELLPSKVETVIENSPLVNVAEITVFSLVVILLIIVISVLILLVYTLFIKKDILTVWNKDIGISLHTKKFSAEVDKFQELTREYATKEELKNLENKYITKEEFEKLVAKYIST